MNRLFLIPVHKNLSINPPGRQGAVEKKAMSLLLQVLAVIASRQGELLLTILQVVLAHVLLLSQAGIMQRHVNA